MDFDNQIHSVRRQALQLNDHEYEITQDIDLKFSAFVYHMSGLNRFEDLIIAQSVGQ